MFIGFILDVVGYFKLASLKKLSGTPAPVTSAAQPTPAAAQSSKKFCPNCGTAISGQEKFCSSCGS
jgi:membrane protease subunit (stomatin/prohibitin family)